MINKDALLKRLKAMVNLPDDWDGFGTVPITDGVYGISKKLVEYIDPDVDSMKVFVGVTTPGTAFIEIRHLLKTFEMTISLGGTIFYNEHLGDVHLGNGSFLPSKKQPEGVLNN